MNIPSFNFHSFMENLGMSVGAVYQTDSSFVAGYAATQTKQAYDLFAEYEAKRQVRLAETLKARYSSN
jgi:hypothetical protein